MSEHAETDGIPLAQLVAAGYDALGARYGKWAARIEGDARDAWVDRLSSLLRPGARVLDLGCGPGVATTRVLAERFAVTGVDIPKSQLDLAREAVPGAQFILADMTTLDFPPESFSAIVALYSLIHLPADALSSLLMRAATWLRPGGHVLATLGAAEGEGIQADWLGVPMFFAGHTPDGNRAVLEAAGFAVVASAVQTTIEPEEGPVRFHWVLARAEEAPPSTLRHPARST
jgi:SAM-dependent methyltransferase